MGETSDGSSAAAQGARIDDHDDQTDNDGETSSENGPDGPSRGFFSRIIEALSPTDQPGQDAPPGTVPPGLTAAAPPGMLNLRRMRVEDVAIPRSDIVAVSIATDIEDLVSVFRESGMTRLPVFDGTLDSPLGFVNLKDFALRFGFNGSGAAYDLRALLRPLLFVPPSMSLGVLLQKMQAERIHMALVIDEYGGTDGLVTIEDLLETVVGDIEDEHDIEETSSFSVEKPGVWLALAKTPLEEFEPAIGMDLRAHDEIDEEEVDTLGGLVFMLAGHVPARGEVIRHPDGPEFEVIEADPRRIKRLRVRLTASGAP